MSNAHVTAKSSLSVGKYWVSTGGVNRDPAKTNLQPSRQHVGIWSNVQYVANPFLALVSLKTCMSLWIKCMNTFLNFTNNDIFGIDKG